MGNTATQSAVRQIELLFDGGSVAALSDGQLLERFTARRDSTAEAAFAALVARYGPMVLGVCRQLVGDQHLADDAFQAVFLVLSRKARTIRNADLLGNWLYGVAVRTSRRAKARLVRQRKKEESGIMGHSHSRTSAGIEPSLPAAMEMLLAYDEIDALHDEITRLPNRFLRPILLCYFEGLTLDDAARQLRWPPGTLRSRLARAREKLRRALTRRGCAMTATALTATLGCRSATARVSSTLCEATTNAAIRFAAGQAAGHAVSASALALAHEVLRSMVLYKLRLMVTALVLLGAAATGAGFVAHSTTVADATKDPPAIQHQPVLAKPENTKQQPAPGRMFIVGRVLDPQGKPVVQAIVMAYARAPLPGRPSDFRTANQVPLGRAQSDGSGSFRLDAPRTSSSRYDRFGAVAIASGFGAGWVELDPDAAQPTADISLRPEQVIQVRLFDVQGRPARGVTISVEAIRSVLRRDANGLPDRSEGPIFSENETNDFPGWPKPAITDPGGRVTLHGIGRGLLVHLTIYDPRYAQQDISIETDDAGDRKQLTIALEPPQAIAGRVIYADTGKPVAHARLWVRADKNGRGRSSRISEADADGRFRVNPASGDQFVVWAYPPKGEPYLSMLKTFDWPKGAVEHPVDMALTRGVLIRGKVTEHASGKPIAGASVMLQHHSKPNAGPSNSSIAAETTAEGSYQLIAVPGPGYLAIKGPGNDYVLQAIGERLFSQGQPGGWRFYSNAFIPCDPKQNGPDLEVNAELRRGMTVRGQAITADGQPVTDIWLISRILSGLEPSVRWPWRRDDHIVARDGRFEIHGLESGAEVPVFFLDPKRKLGATASFSGKMASGGPVTVRLQPCGAAQARLVDSNGKPRDGISAPWLISMIVTPGPSVAPRGQKELPLLADEARLTQIDPINHIEGPDHRRGGPGHVSGADSRRHVSDHRPNYVSRAAWPTGAQGLFREAG